MKTTIYLSTIALFALSCSDPNTSMEKDETAFETPKISEAEQEQIEAKAKRQQEDLTQVAPKERRIQYGSTQGTCKSFFEGDRIVQTDLTLNTENGKEEDSYFFNEDGSVYYSTHRSLMQNFAGSEAPYIVEHKFFYNEDQQIISGLVRHGEQTQAGQMQLEGIPFKDDNPDLGTMNETYLPRLKVALQHYR